MARLILDGLTKKQAKALADWFEGQGEQDCAVWLEDRRVKCPHVDYEKGWLEESGDDIIVHCHTPKSVKVTKKDCNVDQLDPMRFSTDLYVLTEWLKNRSIEVALRDHPAYTEGMPFSPVGTNQLLASSSKGKISIIRGMTSFGLYEIYCLDGDLFEDIERYPDVKSAGERICELLTG